jgi:hypothetical protein
MRHCLNNIKKEKGIKFLKNIEIFIEFKCRKKKIEKKNEKITNKKKSKEKENLTNKKRIISFFKRPDEIKSVNLCENVFFFFKAIFFFLIVTCEIKYIYIYMTIKLQLQDIKSYFFI